MRNKPLGICTTCGVYTFNVHRINTQCGFRRNGIACLGVLRSATGTYSFCECKTCAGVGAVDATSCTDCQGTGWAALVPVA